MFAIQCVGGGLYTFVSGVRNSFGVHGARATTGAIFCGFQHGISEVTFQYQRIFGRSMDDTHVEERRQWLKCDDV